MDRFSCQLSGTADVTRAGIEKLRLLSRYLVYDLVHADFLCYGHIVDEMDPSTQR